MNVRRNWLAGVLYIRKNWLAGVPYVRRNWFAGVLVFCMSDGTG